MRIRKNKKISSLVLSHASGGWEPRQTHVCQLNQSPWDVMNFGSDSSLASPLAHQVEADNSATANGSLGDSLGAVESATSMKLSADSYNSPKPLASDNAEKREEAMSTGEENGWSEIEPKDSGEIGACCNKADGKGWQCRREAKEGHSLCEHHLAQLRSYNSCSGQSAPRKSDKAAAAESSVRRQRARPKKPPPTSSNPYEFYYYSGFGPLWGKKRGNGGELSRTIIKSISSSQIDDGDSYDKMDLLNDDDDDDEEEGGNVDGNGECGRKRTRKPVKARSLKSLM